MHFGNDSCNQSFFPYFALKEVFKKRETLAARQREFLKRHGREV